MTKLAYLVPILLLASCGGSESANDAAAAPADVGAPSVQAGNAAAPAEGTTPASTSATAAQPLAWTGAFAANPQLCNGGRWNFSRTEVVTQGETACSVNNIAEDPGQVKLTLACTAEGMDTLEEWTLTSRPDGGMRVVRQSGGRSNAVDLVRCG